MNVQQKYKGMPVRSFGVAAWIGVFGAGLGLATVGGCNKQSGPTEIANVPAGAVDTSVDRFRVPVGTAPVKGNPTAKVTIIEFSDFQCPFCSRVVDTLEQIEKAYPQDVRVAFKHNPLPFH